MTTFIVQWVKYDKSQIAQYFRWLYYQVRNPQMPALPLIYVPLRYLHKLITHVSAVVTSALYYTPMFKTYLQSKPQNLYLYSGMPQILGNLAITVGNNVRISGVSTFCGRSAAVEKPVLIIGNNVDIGWQNSISVGTLVELKDNVRLAGRVYLAGFPGHPIDAKQRREGLPETDEQAKPIVLEADVWVGTGAIILGGVTVGEGSIVGAGAVVTKSVPPFSIVAGNPAKVVKKIGAKV